MKEKYALEKSVAPDVDPQWVETFIVVLRARGVSGKHISESLAEVNDHLASSGSSVEEAFGPARTYARSLGLPVSSENTIGMLYRAVWPNLLGFVGMTLSMWAVESWHAATAIPVSLGRLLGAIDTIVTLLLLPVVFEPIMSAGVKRRWVPVTALIGWAVILVGLIVIPQEPVLHVSPWPVGTAGVILLAVSTAWILRTPLTDDPVGKPGWLDAKPRRSRGELIRAWLFPAMTVLFALLWLLVA